MYLVCDLTEEINYHKSHFAVYDIMIPAGPIDISSKEDFHSKIEALEKNNPGKTIFIKSEKLFFKDAFKNPYDLFEIGLFDANVYITRLLYNKLLEEKVSGLEIIPATNLF